MSLLVARRGGSQAGYPVAALGTEPVRFLVLWMAGWIHSRQLEVIDFLREENRVLREQLGGRRPRFTDDQRRRLAVKGRIVGLPGAGDVLGHARRSALRVHFGLTQLIDGEWTSVDPAEAMHAWARLPWFIEPTAGAAIPRAA